MTISSDQIFASDTKVILFKFWVRAQWSNLSCPNSLVLRSRGGSFRRAAALPEKCKAKYSAKLALSLDIVTKISQHNHFRHFRHHFGSTFPRNPTKPMFRCLPTTPLMRWRFQHTCRWIWRFRGCHPHSPKGKKPDNWLQKHGGISAYRKAFLIVWRRI